MTTRINKLRSKFWTTIIVPHILQMESTRIFGVGLGVFFISFLWASALILSLIFYRVRPVLSLTFTCFAAALTAVFLALPRAGQNDELDVTTNSISSTLKVQFVTI